MKKRFLPSAALLLAGMLLLGSSFTAPEKTISKEFYQLTIYHCKTAAQVAVTSSYLKSTYLPALHKSGFGNIGVFTSTDNDTAIDKRVYVLIPFGSLKKYEALMDASSKGTLIQNDTSAYTNATHDNKPFERMETALLKAFRDMPQMEKPSLTAPLAERIYELRSYEGPTERLYHQKVKMFNDGGEVTLFKRLNFNAVFYAEVLSGSHMPNLMYMTTFNNKAERDEHWKNFGSDSVWKRISVLPEYLNTVSKADIFFLHPTDFSDY